MRGALVVGGLALALLGAEWALRARWPNEYSVWPPGFRATFQAAPGVMPGVEGASSFTINSSGIRGDEFSSAQGPRILALGGSTTECFYLDDEEAWPRLLQKELAAAPGLSRVWVGNIGRAGGKASNHLLQVRKLLPLYPPIDVVLVLVGINDLLRFLQDPNWRPTRLEALNDPALRDYAALLRAIVGAVRERKATVVFLTQPALWSATLSPELDGLLWMGGFGDDKKKPAAFYYSASALADGLAQYNHTLRAVASAQGVECIDTAAALPRDTTVFYDDCHFNESGARAMAKVVAAGLLAREPLKGAGR